jgi:tetratricopeptide (TPR) repeat protein
MKERTSMMRKWTIRALLLSAAVSLAGCAGGGGPAASPPDGATETAADACRRGEILLAAGDLGAARASFERALAVDPMRPEALAGRGRTRARVGDTRGALGDLDAALRSAGGVLLRSARPTEGGVYADRERALAMSRLIVDIRAARGVLREAAGDAAGAQEDFDEARKLDAPGADEAIARERKGIRS